jgi:hypothetical protein
MLFTVERKAADTGARNAKATETPRESLRLSKISMDSACGTSECFACKRLASAGAPISGGFSPAAWLHFTSVRSCFAPRFYFCSMLRFSAVMPMARLARR